MPGQIQTCNDARPSTDFRSAHAESHADESLESRTCHEARIRVGCMKDQPHCGTKQTERCIESQFWGQGPKGLAKHLLAHKKGRQPPPIFLADHLQRCKPTTKAACTSLERCTKTRDPLRSQNCTLAIVQQPAMLQGRRAVEDIDGDFHRFILLRLAWVLLSGTLASVLRHLSRFPWLPSPLEGHGSASLRHLLAP